MKTSIVLFAAIAALSACGTKTSAPNDAPASAAPGVVSQPAVPVRTTRLERASLSGTITADGQVVADAGGQASLAFPVDGQIASVNVSVGDRVARGSVLASLDPRTAKSAVLQARADLAAANANLAKVQARARPQEFAQNSATVEAAQAKVRAAAAEVARQKALAQAGIVSQRELQAAQADYETDVSDLRIAQQQGSILQSGPRSQDIAVARASVQQAQAALDAAQTKATLLNVTAPFDGVITQRFKDPGETADPASPVLAMIDPQRTVVELQLSQDQGTLVHVGASAKIRVDGSSGSVAGTVIAVSPAIGHQTGTMTVRVRARGATLTPGAAAKASIVVADVSGDFVVPAAAIVKDPDTGATVIFVAKGHGSYARLPVQIQLESAGRVAIVGTGLSAGQSVVTNGAYELLPFAGGASGD